MSHYSYDFPNFELSSCADQEGERIIGDEGIVCAHMWLYFSVFSSVGEGVVFSFLDGDFVQEVGLLSQSLSQHLPHEHGNVLTRAAQSHGSILLIPVVTVVIITYVH